MIWIRLVVSIRTPLHGSASAELDKPTGPCRWVIMITEVALSRLRRSHVVSAATISLHNSTARSFAP